MMGRYLVMDIESGGLGHECSLLTAYLMVLDENLAPGAELDLAIKPENELYVLTAQGMGVNGIDLQKHDKAAETTRVASQRLYEFLKKQSSDGKEKLTPLGHGVAFDVPWLAGPQGLISKNSWEQFVSYVYVDTGVVARFLQDCGRVPRRVKHSLSALAAHFAIEFKEAHTARGDALMTAEVYRKMRELTDKRAYVGPHL